MKNNKAIRGHLIAILSVLVIGGTPEALALGDVGYRRGQHENFERIVFDWPEAASVEVEDRGDSVILVFEPAARFIEKGGAKGTGRALRGVQVLDARTVELSVLQGSKITRLKLDDNRLGFDIHPPAALSAETQEQGPDQDRGLVPDPGFRRDLMIQSLLSRVEFLEGLSPSSRSDQRVAAAAAEAGGSAPAGEAPSLREDLLIDRALERTLASDGTLLIAAGDVELEPWLSYSLADDSVPMFITGADDISLFVGSNEFRRQSLSPGLSVKAGLPWDSQIEAELPWNWADEQLVTAVGANGAFERSDSGSGVGDLRIGLAKTLWRGEDIAPDVVGRIFWDTATGESASGDVGLGGGRHEFGAALSFLKRQDPLAFVGSISAETSLEEDGVERGERFGIGLSAVLAASPQTSLRLGYTHQFERKAEFEGEKVIGSDRSYGILSLGAASIIAKRTLLDLTIGVGLGDDAPDVSARVAMPIRFSVD